MHYSSKPINCCPGMPEGQKGDDGFFVAGDQAAVLFQAPEKALDFVAVAVGFLIHRQRFGAVGVAGNDNFDAALGAVIAGGVAVLGLVSQHLDRRQVCQQGQRLRAVVGLSFGGEQAHGVAQRLDAGVDLGAHPAPAAAQALGFGDAFFWPTNAGRPARW